MSSKITSKQMPFKTKKVIAKASPPPAKRRRSSRKGAGTRPPTFFEQYADDIRAVLLEGEDKVEVLEAFQHESDDACIASEDEEGREEQDHEFVVEEEDDSDEEEDNFDYENIAVNDSESDDDSGF
jgi:hypothetical protein